MPFFFPLQTRYAETAQDGIIHHSSYAIYLEVARIAFFQSLDIDINQLEKQGIFSPLTELALKYKKPLYSSEEIIVELSIASLRRVRFLLSYRIFRKEELIATALSSHCFVNSSFVPIPIPSDLSLKLKETL